MAEWIAVYAMIVSSSACTRMKATDTLILHGRRQHAEQYLECVVGHWPNVESMFRKVPR